MTPQQIEAMKMALDLATMHHTDDGYAALRAKVRYAIKEALAQPEQEPDDGYCKACDGWKCTSKAGCVALDNPPQRTEQEPVAWPCLIDSADFSKNTIMLVMQCEDYKVSAGTHWLSTTPPKENT